MQCSIVSYRIVPYRMVYYGVLWCAIVRFGVLLQLTLSIQAAILRE